MNETIRFDGLEYEINPTQEGFEGYTQDEAFSEDPNA